MRVLLCAVFAIGSLVAPQLCAYGPADRENIEWCDLWLPHANDPQPKLPSVLLIGDSITRGYYPAVEQRLAGKAYVGRLCTSAFVSDPMLLEEITMVLDARKFDVIQFNNGMHGWRHSEAEYRAGFPRLLAVLCAHAPGARLIWANTTPLLGGPVDGRSNARVAARNAIALDFVKPLGIPVVDLNTPMQGHPEYHHGDVHFNEQGIAVQAACVAAEIERVLAD